MSKFHINKHGVPAPCRATKGNCPLGGDESHFDNKEDAQAFIDNQMESKHGLLGELSGTSVKSVSINHDVDEVFPDAWNEHGMQVTGIYSDDLRNATHKSEGWDKGYKDLHDVIKDDADRIAKEKGDSDYALIPEKNMESHMRNHVLYPGDTRYEEKPEEGWVTFNQLTESAEKHFGSDVLEESDYEDVNHEFNENFHEELIKFGAKRMKEDSQFNINGKSVYLETGDGPYDTNWVDEYAKAIRNGTEKSKFEVISKD